MLKYFRGRSFGYIFRFVLAAPLALVFWLCIEVTNIFRPVYIVGLSYKGRITQYLAPMELHLRQANQTKKRYPAPEAMTSDEMATLTLTYLALGAEIEDIYKKWLRCKDEK